MENKEPNRQKSKTKFESTSVLKTALRDAEMLLAHAAEYGIEVDTKHIKAIVDAKAKEQNENWTEEDEINLWQAYQTISKLVQPVSIDSIRASSENIETPSGVFAKIFNIKRKRSLVRRSVRWYSGFALISMLFMLGLQIYSLQGTKYLSNLEAGINRLSEIENRTEQLMLMSSEDRSISMEQDRLTTERTEKIKEVESNIKLLENWLNFTYDIWSKSPAHIHDEIKASAEMSSYGPPDFTQTGGTTKNIVVIQQAKSLLIILNQYILPLMYGLLGGFAFVLRSLAAETKSMTYTAVSNIKYALRIHLGALAGLVVGFLWGDIASSSFGMASSFSPLAVAFIAGYSVEFMFRLFDSLIGAKEDKKGNDSLGSSKKS
jgi:hypothetical protein